MWLRNIRNICILFCVSVSAYAADNTLSMGEFAQQLMTPVGLLGSFISTASLFLGVVCLFSGFLKYLEHRKNPYAAPISSVAWLVVLGILFVGLPILSHFMGAEVNPLQKF